MPEFELLSDIHSNEWKTKLNLDAMFPAKAPTLILAGDIGKPEFSSLHNLLRYVCTKYKDIIYVPGNHEFYDKPPHEVISWFKKVDDEFSNFHFFYRRTQIIDGIRIIGATGWCTAPHETIYSHTISNEGRKDIDFINQTLSKATEPTLVVTHYAPSLRCVNGSVKDFLKKYDYAQDLEYMFRPPIKAWIFGHIHQDYDFTVPYSSSMFGLGNIRLLCKPYGKPSDPHMNISKAFRFILG